MLSIQMLRIGVKCQKPPLYGRWNVDNYVESVDICPEYTVNIHVKLIMPLLSPCRIIGIFPAKSKKYAQKE